MRWRDGIVVTLLIIVVLLLAAFSMWIILLRMRPLDTECCAHRDFRRWIRMTL